MWLSRLSASLWTYRLLVWFPVRAHAWDAGPQLGACERQQTETLMLLSLSPLPFPLSKNKRNKIKKFSLKRTIIKVIYMYLKGVHYILHIIHSYTLSFISFLTWGQGFSSWIWVLQSAFLAYPILKMHSLQSPLWASLKLSANLSHLEAIWVQMLFSIKLRELTR